MGILTGHRINFWGGTQTDVCTANNTQTVDGEDILDLVNAKVVSTDTDAQLVEMMRTPTSPGARPGGDWNYYGNHQVLFVDSKVSSQGAAGSVSIGGDLADDAVKLLGSLDPQTGDGPYFGPVMVDLDPTSSQTTQIFVGGLQIGPDSAPKLLIRHDTVCSNQGQGMRILNGADDAPGSSVGAGTFQVFFPTSSIVSYDTSCADLVAIITDPNSDGIVLRFSMFEMAPLMTTAQQVADYEANLNSSNPSSGSVIGTLGSHYPDEPDTTLPGRLLVNQQFGGAAYANVDETGGYLSMDMVSTIPKENFRADRTDFTGPIGANIDYGDLTVTAGGQTIGVVNPQPSDYYLYGGIVDLAVDAGQVSTLNANAISMAGTNGGNSIAIAETPLRIYSNDRNVYLAGSSNISCVVSYLGGALNVDTTFTIDSSSSGTIPNPNFLDFPATINASAGATTLSFSVSDNGSAAGFEALTVNAGNSSYFVNFRTYPVTDFGIAPGSIITWDQLYENALRFFYVVFPAMSKVFNLSDEATIRGHKFGIIKRTGDAYRDTTLYMPIVRSMTPSQVKLLNDFLNDEPWAPLS